MQEEDEISKKKPSDAIIWPLFESERLEAQFGLRPQPTHTYTYTHTYTHTHIHTSREREREREREASSQRRE
jgi:hypothetical protein